MAKDTKYNPAEADFIATARAPSGAKFTAADMRAAFQLGHAYGRSHVFNPQEMNAVKAAEEALANWPD